MTVQITDLIATLRAAQRITVLTGAGVSAESGIPTFRDPLTGLWEKYDPSALATPGAYRGDPPLVWGWYEWRRMKVLRAQPNPAHLALARMAALVPELILVTQNVDDLHERAGSPGVLHLHGRLMKPICFACHRPHALPPGIPDLPEGGARIDPPRCTHCDGKVRPGVVWFGERLPESEFNAAAKAAHRCQVFLCIGTSAVVQPAASLLDMAAEASAVTVQINPNPTAADNTVDYALRGPAGAVLPDLVAQVWGT